jgi:hypothetical protein
VRNGIPSGLVGASDAFVAGFNPAVGGDASLIYCTFLGGSSIEQGYGITAAPDGTLWVVGQTYSPDFPVSGNAYQGAPNGGPDAFITHLDPIQGGYPLYSTYLGGSGLDSAQRVAVDAKGRIVVTGYTTSGDFPVSPDAAQASNKGSGDAFIFILNPASANQRVYGTYYGGTGAEVATGLVTDAKGMVYISGFTGSADLPLTGNAMTNQRMGGQDGFILKLDPTVPGPAGMLYSSFIASTGTQVSYGVDVSANGIIYLVGFTTGAIFDPLGGVARVTATGTTDSFLMGINPQ